MARRSLSPEEESLWQSFARHIRPLHSRHNLSGGRESTYLSDQTPLVRQVSDPVMSKRGEQATVLCVRKVSLVGPTTPPKAIHTDRLRINDRQPGLDNTSWKTLSSGKMKPQKRLDLHGHLAQDAFFKLYHFLHACSERGIRCVEVITGLGSGVEGGVIRQELPHWLERGDLRPLVLAVVHTHKKNKGAVRILLRAKKNG